MLASTIRNCVNRQTGFNGGVSRSIAGLGRRGDSKHHHFLVYAPDMTDGEATQRRFAVRPKHLEKVAPLIQSSVIKVAGMTITPESIAEGAEKKPKGSLLIFEAESLEEVKQIIERDIYFTEKVWDADKITIFPFLPCIFASYSQMQATIAFHCISENTLTLLSQGRISSIISDQSLYSLTSTEQYCNGPSTLLEVVIVVLVALVPPLPHIEMDCTRVPNPSITTNSPPRRSEISNVMHRKQSKNYGGATNSVASGEDDHGSSKNVKGGSHKNLGQSPAMSSVVAPSLATVAPPAPESPTPDSPQLGTTSSTTLVTLPRACLCQEMVLPILWEILPVSRAAKQSNANFINYALSSVPSPLP
ncbi:hypothetical protein PC9H_007707 [Pleurotus ostreatus]|uniref:YCII-related domain-containing protein n=1 Tax=Pleurotus ostreatus TaxID=5322 RepID=A0A8H6ZVE3_PLEOS|nr:uncharacterized protein PC9H_007707 [Pleurotus ostreatus]KAF7428483.1 hypothetical protein PC9H_007707 [Pleurotus ostreatus]